MSACLTSDEIVALLAGELPPERSDAVIAHLDSCAACADVVAASGAFDAESERSVGRYRLDTVIGAGAMGIVYRAWDPQLHRRVAIKLVRPERADDDGRARMLREARALAQISHPNVIAVHDVGEHHGEVFVATELVDGETLATWTAGRSHDEIIDAWTQAALGLAAAHAGGIVHRDVKPANVLVGRDGRVRIGDFGLASHDSEDTSTIAGTPAYMAPEQARGVVDARSDQFALCVALAEALTGRRPRANDRPVVEPPALAAALARGMRADPARRFPAMAALIAALGAVARPRRRRWPALLAALAVVLVGGIAIARRSASPTCTVPSTDGVWTAALREELALPPQLEQRITHDLAAWQRAAADTCAPTTPPAVRDRRARCITTQLAAYRRQFARWREAPVGALVGGLLALDQLPQPAMCAVPALRAPEPALLGPVIATRIALEDVRSLAQAEQLLVTARALGDPATHAAALAVNATAVAYRSRDAARTQLREAVSVAEGDDYALVIATLALLARMDDEGNGEATRRVEHALAALQRLAGDAALAGRLEHRLGELWANQRAHDDAQDAYEWARRSFVSAYGEHAYHVANAALGAASARLARDPQSEQARTRMDEAAAAMREYGMELGGAADPHALIRSTEQMVEYVRQSAGAVPPDVLFTAEINYANAYDVAGDSARAVEHYTAAVRLGDQLGGSDPRLAFVLGQLAATLLPVDLRTALAHGKRAVAIADATEDTVEQASALTVYGEALVEAGQLAAAREHLARALALREASREPGRFRGNTRFQYARSLYAVDRARAIGLAHAAKVDVEGDLATITGDDPGSRYVRAQAKRRIATIQRWLAAH